ncbi:MAG: reverse transcriptase domain-containing protein [Sphingobium sp.]
MDQLGYESRFKSGIVTHYSPDGNILATGSIQRRVYRLNARAAEESCGETASFALHRRALTHDEWHRVFGHISITGIQTLAKSGLVNGLNIDANSRPSPTCIPCIEAKAKHYSFPKVSTPHNYLPGEMSHSDLWGPARVSSIGKAYYYISFIDDATRRNTIRFLKKKSDATHEIQTYVLWVENQLGRTPKVLKFDNGREFVNKTLQDWCATKGIDIQLTAPYAHAQHGVAERPNRTLIELARAMLIAKNLPHFLWAEAVSYAAYLRFRVSTPALTNKTPYEAWHGSKPNVSHLREFGCDVWILSEGSNRSKLDPKANKFVFVGFEEGPKAVRYYNPATRRILVSRDAYFNENSPPAQKEDVVFEFSARKSPGPANLAATPAAVEGETYHSAPEASTSPPSNPQEPPPNPSSDPALSGRSTRQRSNVNYRLLNNPQARKEIVPAQQTRPAASIDLDAAPELAAFASECFPEIAQTAQTFTLGIPETLAQAKNSPEWPKWEKAMISELEMLKKKETWVMENIPQGRSPVGNRWVFAKKYDADGNLSRFKARLVAKGFTQIPGSDFHNTFSPVMRMDSLRTIIALATLGNLHTAVMDITGAFLNGTIQEEIYMHQPQGFSDNSGRFCRLLHTLYGLKQSGREWNDALHAEMTRLGYKRLDGIDHCVYIRSDGSGMDIICVWVDDLHFACTSSLRLNKAQDEIDKVFEATRQGEPRLLLGIQINRDHKSGTISLSQGQYIRKVLQRFQMGECGKSSTPMDSSIHLIATTDATKFANPLLYRAAIGSLMYASLATRPDISFSVQKLAQFSHNPSNEHWTAVKHVLRDLQGSKDRGLTYSAQDDQKSYTVTAYSDADWAADRNDRKSTSGNVFQLAGAAISWSSKKQQTVSLSSMESEYMAVTNASKQAIWLRRLLTALGHPPNGPSKIFVDNKSALDLAYNPEFHDRSKHIDIRHHFIRETLAAGTVSLEWIPTDHMIADVLTKPLASLKFSKFIADMGMDSN